MGVGGFKQLLVIIEEYAEEDSVSVRGWAKC